VPWWAALLIATTATAIGYAIDAGSGHKELTDVFAGFYIAGCVVAVLAVRQEGMFTAIIQPPLILFCAVPGAYWLFHGGKVGNIKDLLINCGYPLIERFPLMLGTAGGVLLIGLVRRFFGMTHRTTAAAHTKDDTADTADPKSVIRGIIAKLASILHPDSDDEANEAPSTGSQPVHAVSRPAKASPKTSRAARGTRSAQRPARTRSRHARPPLEDTLEPPVERPRRRRPTPARDFDAADPPRRSRQRPRPQSDPDLRAQPPREFRRDSRAHRNPYERPAPRSSRFDGYDRYEPPGTPEHFNRYEPHEPYEPYEPPYEPRRRRAASGGPNSANPTHHPISRVRYRGQPPPDELRDEPHAERRDRSRAPGRSQGRPRADSWEYDV
jgi:Domain of unknown function (DUF6542)